jgi:hypothetical protein
VSTAPPTGSTGAVAVRDIDEAGALAERALELLHAARRRAASGIREAGPGGDIRRAELEIMLARADEALYEARLVLDRVLTDVTLAPRPVIALPA